MMRKRNGEKKLGRDEAEALLNDDAQENTQSERETASDRRIEKYDFSQPTRYNRSELERLRQTSSQFPKRIVHSLARLMRCQVGVELTDTLQTQWQHIVEDAGDLSVGYVFDIEPWGHRGIVVADRTLASLCVDWLTGNAGGGGSQSALTELEGRVFSHVLQRFYEPLPRIWGCAGDFAIKGEEYVTDVGGKGPFSPVEELFNMTFAVEGDFGSGKILLVVPFAMVRRVLQALDEAHQARQVDQDTRAAVRSRLRQVPLEVAVELGSTHVPVRSLFDLDRGDIIILNRACADMLEVRVNGRRKLQGYPVLSRGRLAVKIDSETK